MLLVMVVNGLSPIQHKAIIKTDIVLSITSFGINLDEMSIETKRFLAATKQLYKWYFPSVRLSVCPSVHLSVTPF